MNTIPMKIFENIYFELTFQKASSTIFHKAFPETINMTDDEFKEGFNIASEKIEEYKAKNYLSDVREQYIAITPELQFWVVENVYPRWSKAGLEKLAIVLPQDLISSLSVEQAVDEIVENVITTTYQINYFDGVAKAESWLNS